MSTTPAPYGGHHGELDSPVSEHLPGGMFATGTRVRVQIIVGGKLGEVIGTIVDRASTPAAYLSLAGDDGGRVVVFLGPGVIITAAGPRHPAE